MGNLWSLGGKGKMKFQKKKKKSLLQGWDFWGLSKKNPWVIKKRRWGRHSSTNLPCAGERKQSEGKKLKNGYCEATSNLTQRKKGGRPSKQLPLDARGGKENQK